MSRDARKLRTAAKRQPGKKPGRRPLDLEVEPIDLENKAEALSISREHHSQLLTSEVSREIQHRVEELSLEADRLREVNKQPYKCRSRELNTILEDNISQQHSSSEHEEIGDEASGIDSQDTRKYSEHSKSSPSYHFGISPTYNSGNNNPPFVFNPQAINNPPQTSPIVTASQLDPMAKIQTMFSQQAEANKQQAEDNRQVHLLIASSLDKQIDQQSK